MITSGCTASTQYAYAEMLRLSTEGTINFVADTREWLAERRDTQSQFPVMYIRDMLAETMQKRLGIVRDEANLTKAFLFNLTVLFSIL